MPCLKKFILVSNLLELKTRVGDIAVVYFQKAATYSQTRVYDILQYIAAQSVPQGPVQRQLGGRVHRPAPVPNQTPANVNPRTEEPLSPTSSSSSGQDTQRQEHVEEEYVVLPRVPKNDTTAQNEKIPALKSSTVGTSNQQASNSEKEAMQIDSVPASSEPKEPSPPPTTILQDNLRVTRARMRRNPPSGY